MLCRSPLQHELFAESDASKKEEDAVDVVKLKFQLKSGERGEGAWTEIA